jgi:hypothetical protein
VSADARVFRLQLALGGAGVLAAVLALAEAARTVRVAPAAGHRLDLAGLRFTYPAANAAAIVLFGLAALGAAVLIVAVRAGWRQARAHRRLVRRLPVAGPLPGHPATVVDADAPLAFCAGWLRPRVFVSRGALERLAPEQLQAVLAHEHHHRAVRDPLRLAAGRVLSQALFFLPVLRPLHHRYGEAAEVAADAAAIRASGPAPLAAALLQFGAGPDGVAGISPERVDSLLGRAPARRLPRAALIAGLVTLAGLVALVWRASAGATVATTLNLPIASSQPCILVLALVPVVAALAGAISRLTYD